MANSLQELVMEARRFAGNYQHDNVYSEISYRIALDVLRQGIEDPNSTWIADNVEKDRGVILRELNKVAGDSRWNGHEAISNTLVVVNQVYELMRSPTGSPQHNFAMELRDKALRAYAINEVVKNAQDVRRLIQPTRRGLGMIFDRKNRNSSQNLERRYNGGDLAVFGNRVEAVSKREEEQLLAHVAAMVREMQNRTYILPEQFEKTDIFILCKALFWQDRANPYLRTVEAYRILGATARAL